MRPVVLLILDGVGCRDARPDNAIARARKPNWDALAAACPHTTIDASELRVGLPEGRLRARRTPRGPVRRELAGRLRVRCW